MGRVNRKKRREEEKPQETFCTIPRNRGAFRQATAIPPETRDFRGALARARPPSGAGERELLQACWARVSQLCSLPWEQSQGWVPDSLEPGAPMWLELE